MSLYKGENKLKQIKMNFNKLNNNIKKNSMDAINTLKKIALFSSIGLITLTSCKSESNDNDEESQADGVALNQRFIDNRNNALQIFSIDASSGGTIIGNQGTKVIIPANSLGLNGNPIVGNVDIELIEIYDKAAMVLQNMSTKGQRFNGDEEALKSAGEFFVNARQNGNQLEVLNPITIESREIDPADFEPMNVFRAGDNLEDDNIWEAADENNDGINDAADNREGQGPDGGFVLYSAFDMSEFGWTNLDIWYNFAGQLTDLFVDVPDGFDGENSAVYLSYNGENGLAKMDIYDTTLEQFTEHFGRIPVGQEVHFIMISDIDGVINYAIQAATIVEDHLEVMNNLQPISQADLTVLINGLP